MASCPSSSTVSSSTDRMLSPHEYRRPLLVAMVTFGMSLNTSPSFNFVRPVSTICNKQGLRCGYNCQFSKQRLTTTFWGSSLRARMASRVLAERIDCNV